MSSNARPATFFFLGVAAGLVLCCLSSVAERKRVERPAPRRYGAAIQLHKDRYERYRELHDNVWPAVLERMSQSNIRNFVIYYHKETSTLFQHFEWTGHWTRGGALSKQEEDQRFKRDMEAIAQDPITRKWWKECEPCQKPFSQWSGQRLLSDGGSGDWWAPLECVAHCGHWPLAYSKQLRDPDFVPLHR